MSEHFIRPDNDPEPTDAEFSALADEYQAGLDKGIASGYEEYGPRFQRRHAMVIAALRAYVTETSLNDGCCSAIKPCSHQRSFPDTLCAVCQKAAATKSAPPEIKPPVKTEQDAYDLGYLNPSVSSRIWKWKHLVDVNAYRCGQVDCQNHAPRNASYSHDDYESDTFERKLPPVEFEDDTPSATTPADGADAGEQPVELWKGDRKVTIYNDVVLRVWGPNIETEMTEYPRTHETVNEAVDWLYAASPAPVEAQPVGWRCFFCDEVFTSRQDAAEHFGEDEHDCEPACKIASSTEYLIRYVRELEAELSRWRSECHPLQTTIMAMDAGHRRDLVREEERGFARGLEDARKEFAATPPASPSDDLRGALEAVRKELWVECCLRAGRTDIDPRPFESTPVIRIIDAALEARSKT